MDSIVPILVVTLGAGTPLIFAALGELITEKSGVLNLGVEGMMLFSALSILDFRAKRSLFFILRGLTT